MCPWYPQNSEEDDLKISPVKYANIIKKANAFAASRSWSSKYKLQLRFKGQFCYVDCIEKDGTVSALGRLRHLESGRWSVAFFTYSNDRYTPCRLPNGKDSGSLEEVLTVCEAYLF